MTLQPDQRMAGVEQCLQGLDSPAADIERALTEDAFRSLASFTQQLWSILEPGTPLEWNWYLDLLCRELEKVTSGETRDLLICMPPGFMKSLMVSVFWPAWWWLRQPHLRFLTTSGVEDLAIRDNGKMRQVVESEWYGRLVARLAAMRGIPVWKLEEGENRKRNFQNTVRGVRQCYGMTGSVTGNRGDGYLVDDPHQVNDVLGDAVNVKAKMDGAWNRVSVVLPTRVNDHRKSWRVVVQQRVHPDDVAGRIIKMGKARTVILPMHAYDLDDPDRHPEDPRAPGELLDPVRVDETEAQSLAQKLDEIPGQASAQLEQKPRPPKGGLIKVEWSSQRYDFDPQRPEVRFPLVALTVDCTFKETRTGSYVSIQAWGIRGTQRYLLGEVRARMDFVATRQAIRDARAMWVPKAILVEEKANGAAVIRDLKDEFPEIVPVVMDKFGDKTARAQLAAPVWAAGNVHLPQPQWMRTVGEYVDEIRAFPFGPNDRMDAMSQLFLWLADNEHMWRSGDALARGLRGLAQRAGLR